MKEVSVRILEMFFRELRKKRLPPEVLVEGVGYPVAHFENKHERIEWDAFVRMMENAQRIWTEDEIVEMGGAWIDSPFLQHTRLIAGALFTPKQFYRWLASDTKPSRLGASVQMFTCITTTYQELDARRLRLEVRIDEGYAPCRAFFLLSKGGFRDIPRLLGKGRAAVDMLETERGAIFDVTLPPGSERVSVLRRALRWVSAPALAARELDEAHAELQVRYEQLEVARSKVTSQAAQLRTAHTVNELVQQNLDLELTLEAIASALVKEAGFARARVDVDVEVDGVRIVRSVDRGQGDGTRLERRLDGRGGRQNGKLTVFAGSDAASIGEREELLSFIVPSISMAIDNAISYLVVEEYRRGLELRVAERTAELRQARDKLAETVEHLENAKKVRDRIFADINHDLRSPLTLVLLAVEEARRSASLSEEGARALDAIEHGARRVLRMVDELLILAEGREGEVRLWTAPCDLGPFVRRATDVWRPAARIAGLTLDVRVEDGIVVRADPNALDRVLANLLSNAVKFTPAGGTIAVRLFSEGGHAVLEVQDDGPGIDEELRGRLFRRFERGKGAKIKYVGGSGLGLSLVRELVEAHGGTVTVRDANPNGGRARGCIFRVELPPASARTSLAPPNPSSRPPPALGPRDYGVPEAPAELPIVYEPAGTPRATLLLAEDDPELRDRTAKLLAEEYRVYAAADGLAALELAQQHSPDLLLTDVAMPGIDGIELTRRFRALPNNRLAPVLVLTTFGGVRDKLTGFDAGAVDYIHKPFEPDELRARVRSQLTLRSLALQLLETEKLAALGTLSAGLAHELRNPANGIINAVEPLKELLPPECVPPGSPAAQLLDVIEHCSKQVAAMSRQLLGFKRDVEPNRQPVPIETLISRVCTTLTPSLEGIELRKELGYRGVVHCAEPLMAQVLANLLQNGAHAAGRGGWVEVRTGLEDQRVFVEVRDSGPGVPEELRERIFEPFFTTKPAGSGTGLGLSTARDIVLRHGGTLDVRSASGTTVFRVELPLPS